MKSRWAKESGGVTAIVSILTASLLLYGTLALVVDGGIILLERRTVVNAAQSAALALARECIQNPNSCATSPQVQELANLNSPDQKTAVTEICVNGKTSSNTNCQGLTTSKLDCTDMTGKRFVRVRTKSLSNESGIGIRTFFSADASQTLIACSQVRIGNASSAPVYSPFAVSICEWAKQQSLPRVLLEFRSNDSVSSCVWSFVDMNDKTVTANGISGWAALDLLSSSLPESARASVSCPNPSTDQPAYLQIGMQLNQITKDQDSKDYCSDGKLVTKMSNWIGKDLYLPLISTAKLAGGSTVHRIEAFAAFKLLGYSLQKGGGSGSSSDVGGAIPIGNWCPRNTNCLYGQFISTFSPTSEISNVDGIPNVGLQAIELS